MRNSPPPLWQISGMGLVHARNLPQGGCWEPSGGNWVPLPLKLDGENATINQLRSLKLLYFGQILYRVWTRDIRYTTDVQDQQVKGQDHSMT